MVVLTHIAWAVIPTFSEKKVFPTTSDLERGIGAPRFSIKDPGCIYGAGWAYI